MPLWQLYPYKNDDVDDAIVDIVAVHGLNASGKSNSDHAWDTWRKPLGSDGQLWLRDDLPSRAAKSRIFLYEYDARLEYAGERVFIVSVATRLLQRVLETRTQNPHRPLIFLGHGVGGTVIKQALENSFNYQEYQSISEATTAVVFFETPHWAGNGRLLSNTSAALQLVDRLRLSPDASERTHLAEPAYPYVLVDPWQQRLLSYQFVSIFGRDIADDFKQSMEFGLPGIKEDFIELQACHNDICRFSDQSNGGKSKKIVLQRLEKLYDAVESKEPLARDSWGPISQEHFLAWLHDGDFGIHESIQVERHGTCKWLLESRSYCNWVSGESPSQLFWGHGTAGVGKTFASSFVIDDLRATIDPMIGASAYLYVDFADKTRQTPRTMAALILRQLVSTNAQVRQYCKELYKRHNHGSLPLSLNELEKTLAHCFRVFTQRYLIIDAIDHADSETLRPWLVKLIHHLQREEVRIFVTARCKAHEISKSLLGAMEFQMVANDADMTAALECWVSSQHTTLQQGTTDDIIRAVLSCTNNSFLAAQFYARIFVAKVVDSHTFEELHRLGRRFHHSSPFQHIYDRQISIIDRLTGSDRTMAYELLRWLLHAKRPLTVDELSTALAIPQTAPDETPKITLNARSFVKLGHGLVRINSKSKTVTFANETIKQYLEYASPELNDPTNCSLTCATLFGMAYNNSSTDSREELCRLLKRAPVLGYAGEHLLSHLFHSSKVDAKLTRKFRELTEKDEAFRLFLQAGHATWTQNFQHVQSILDTLDTLDETSDPFEMIFPGVDIIPVSRRGDITKCWKAMLDEDCLYSDLEPALILAVENGHTRLVLALLFQIRNAGHRDPIAELLGRALRTAISQNFVHIAWILTEMGADLALPDENGKTPLHLATEGNHVESIDFLLAKAKNIRYVLEARTSENDRALHIAARRGFRKIIEKLIVHGANCSAKNDIEGTPLQTALDRGRYQIANMLLALTEDHDSLVDSSSCVSRSSKSALSLAAGKGYIDIIYDMIQMGADVSVTSKSGETPLMHAAEGNHADVVALLVSSCTDQKAYVARMECSGLTALHYAASRDACEAGEMLLALDADPHASSPHGQTVYEVARSWGSKRFLHMLSTRNIPLRIADAASPGSSESASDSGQSGKQSSNSSVSESYVDAQSGDENVKTQAEKLRRLGIDA